MYEHSKCYLVFTVANTHILICTLSEGIVDFAKKTHEENGNSKHNGEKLESPNYTGRRRMISYWDGLMNGQHILKGMERLSYVVR